MVKYSADIDCVRSLFQTPVKDRVIPKTLLNCNSTSLDWHTTLKRENLFLKNKDRTKM